MEYGLIKDTTMTAIADGLRDKGIVPKYKKAIKPLKYKTPNATSVDDPTPTYEQTSAGESVSVTVPSPAVGMELIVDVGYYENPETDSYYINSIYDAATISIKTSTLSVNERLSVDRNSERHYSYIIPAPTVDIAVYDNIYASGYKDWVACTIAAYPLDANNNRLATDTDEISTITPAEMINSINNSVSAPPEDAFNITGNCSRLFEDGKWSWFITTYSDKITTDAISNMSYMFNNNKEITKLPFTINISEVYDLTSAFNGMSNLEECPKIRGTFDPVTKFEGDSCLSGCSKLTDIEDLLLPEMLDFFVTQKCTSAYLPPRAISISSCNLLRELPTWWYRFRLNPESTAFPTSYYTMYYYLISSCYMLNAARDIPVWVCTAPATSNLFGIAFSGNCYLKAFTFETNEGQPIVANWKAQTIDLTSNIGYTTGAGHQNTIIAAGYGDKRIHSDEDYQALKDDPDSWSGKPEYSKYNHDSAVETINSLPDTSAYLASAGGTNTIKFRGISGELTDAGAINTLTAEEIAVAAAKGWTVSIV